METLFYMHISSQTLSYAQWLEEHKSIPNFWQVKSWDFCNLFFFFEIFKRLYTFQKSQTGKKKVLKLVIKKNIRLPYLNKYFSNPYILNFAFQDIKYKVSRNTAKSESQTVPEKKKNYYRQISILAGLPIIVKPA